MPYNPQIHHRRSTRLRDWDYSGPGWYYVTLCTHGRACDLGEVKENKVILSPIGRIAEETWRWLGDHHENVGLDGFVVMPNHLHGIIIIHEPLGGGSRTAPTEGITSKSLGRLIGAFKTISTKRINEMKNSPGIIFWQRNFHDHIILNDADLNRIRSYIENNPLQWSIDEENPESKNTPRANVNGY